MLSFTHTDILGPQEDNSDAICSWQGAPGVSVFQVFRGGVGNEDGGGPLGDIRAAGFCGAIFEDTMSSDLALAAFLDELMRRRKLLPSQLAGELGVSHATISRWLSGEDVPNVNSCRRLAGYCGMPVERILSIVGHLPGAPGAAANWPEFCVRADARKVEDFDDDLFAIVEDIVERNGG